MSKLTIYLNEVPDVNDYYYAVEISLLAGKKIAQVELLKTENAQLKAELQEARWLLERAQPNWGVGNDWYARHRKWLKYGQ